MIIVADENIPYVREAFAGLGEVRTVPGRSMTAATVRDADLLLVRSVTKVNDSLLDGSKVRFVATATIGEDHLDKACFQARGITYASAPGSNANSVGEYMASTLLRIAGHYEFELEGRTLGIVGVGNVGSRVQAKAEALGMTCVLNDPPLAQATGDARYRPIDELFDCDVLTFHVPMVREGEHATFHMVDEAFLARMKPGAILINSARGSVVKGDALAVALERERLLAAVLDVWEGEPDIDTNLLERVFVGTPHIAGYSFDGKVNGTRQIYEAACRFLGIAPAWDPAPLVPAPEMSEITVDGSLDSVQEAVSRTVFAVYDVLNDDEALRGLFQRSPQERPAYFDRLRKEYPRRREFHNFTARIWPPNHRVYERLTALGFTCLDR